MRVPRHLRWPLLTALATTVVAVEPVVATPFAVRREVQEWCEEADRGGERGALLARAEALLAVHAGLLYPSAEGARPIAEVVSERLRRLGLEDAFAAVASPQAERRLGEARSDADLLAVAQGFPGTPAARRAWRRLADRAWDAGRLGGFLRSETLAAASDPVRAARAAAARTLLAAAGEVPPERLAGLDELWRIQREGFIPAGGRGTRRRPSDAALGETAVRLAFSAPSGELTAVSDGLRLRLIDHLGGREVASPLPIGNTAPVGRPTAPIAVRDGFVAAGLLDQQRLILVRCDRQGAVRWRVLGPAMGFEPAVSAPVLVDGLVCVASLDESEGGTDLMLRAWSVEDGALRWESLLARLGAGRGWLGGGGAPAAPGLVVADGDLLVLPHRGLLARAASDGRVLGLWTYPARAAEAAAVAAHAVPVRAGSLVSDGSVVVATPADADGLAVILGPVGPLRIYRGDGAGGAVVAAVPGLAFLAGNTNVIALDLATLRSRWMAPAPASTSEEPPLAFAGDGRLLLGAGGDLRLYALADGRALDRRAVEGRSGLGLASGLLLAGGDARVLAWGVAQALGERLAAAAAAAPQDWRPRAALAAVAANHGDDERAIGLYEEALARGAPADYAEQAARLLRASLDLARPAAMPPLWERLAALGAGPGELAWWRGRQAQAEGRAVAAAAAFRAVLAAPDRLLAVRGRLSVSLHALAGLALAPSGAEVPAWAHAAVAAPAAAAAQRWQAEERRGRALVLADGIALGYADGVVSARRIGDGVEIWWRRPSRPLLGVQQRAAAPGDGLPLSVFPGTAAAAAGMRSGDLLLRFNGVEVRDFAGDLVPAVLQVGVRGEFTAVVRRKDRELELRGRLGGELAEPVAAGSGIALVWPTLVQGGRPEGLWFAVHDLASGAELWRHSLPPATRETAPPAPMIAVDGLVIAPDGADLVALEARAGTAGEPAGRTRWRLGGLGPQLARARLVHPALLWLPDPEAGIGRLVDAATGRLLAELPADSARPPLLAGDDLLVARGERTLACYDLSRGALRWNASGSSPAVAVEGDAVYCLDAADRLRILDRVSGAVRREQQELGQVLAVHRAGSSLFLHHAPEAGAHAISAIAAAGGAVRWVLRLPPGVEVVATAPDGEGLALVAADRDAAGDGEAVYVRLDADGHPRSWCRLDQDPVLARPQFLAGGVLQAWPEGIAVRPGASLASPPRLTCADLPADLLPGAALAGAAWRTCGEVRWTLARRAGRLLLAARGGELRVRLGDPGQAIDQAGGELRLRPDGEPGLRWRQVPALGAWRVAAAGTAEGGVRWVELEPPPGRQAGQPLALRVSAGEAVDGAVGPWWLMDGWIPVLGAP